MPPSDPSDPQLIRKGIDPPLFKKIYNSRFLMLVQRIVTPVAFSCLTYFGWTARESIISIVESAEGYFWVTALLLLVIRNLLQGIHTTMVLRGLGNNVSWFEVQRITIERLPARYLPGGIWHSVTQAVDLKNIGVPLGNLTAMFFLQQVMAIGTALGIGALGLAIFHPVRKWLLCGAGISSISFVGIVVLFLIVVSKLRKRGFNIQTKALTYAFILSFVGWIVPAMAFDNLVTGFLKTEITATSLLIGSVFIFSRGVGFLAIFAPQGIGVFEFVAASLLPSSYEASSVAVILLSFRIIGFLADTVTYGFFMAIKYIQWPCGSFLGRR